MAFRKVKVNWVLKAAVFNLLDRMPAGEKLYYLLQRYVTKTIPRVLSPTETIAAAQISHADTFRKNGIDLTKAHFMEFGAGWDLYSNIIMYCMGVDHQYVVDIRRWAKAESINAVITYLQTDPPKGAIRVPGPLLREATLEDDLKNFYGISYHAPADASKLPVADASFDLIATTSTLEHIPPAMIAAIMKECHRVLQPQGLMRHVIDYSDHYAHADPGITDFNYLQFNERQWKKFNPGIHFQNRLRRKEYTAIFNTSGFEVIDIVRWWESQDVLDTIKISPAFHVFSLEELSELGSSFLLRKKA